MINDSATCPLCGEAPEHATYEAGHDLFAVTCARCGRFRISAEASISLQPQQKYLASAYCRRALRGGSGSVTILSNNLKPLIDSLPHYSLPEKMDNLLALIAEMTPGPGEVSRFQNIRDYPLVIARDRSEVDYLARELISRKYLDGARGYAVTMQGWERLEQIRAKGHSSTRCFVAMWFDASMGEVYDGAIEPAISDAGYEPLRIDRHEHVNRIDDEIIGQIKRSRFMVADFTGQRHGVYFEAGLMLGLGRSVVWMCRKEELSKEGGLHFDVRQYNFITYESATEARKKLYDRILAQEGEGPVLKPGS